MRASLENQRRMIKKRGRDCRAKEASVDAAAATDYSELGGITFSTGCLPDWYVKLHWIGQTLYLVQRSSPDKKAAITVSTFGFRWKITAASSSLVLIKYGLKQLRPDFCSQIPNDLWWLKMQTPSSWKLWTEVVTFVPFCLRLGKKKKTQCNSQISEFLPGRGRNKKHISNFVAEVLQVCVIFSVITL